MSRLNLRFRQIHLDFHTSEHVEGIGHKFDAEEFASTLDRARIDSITCFARCHHGYIYFDTKRHPERKHPHLKKDLLKEQIEACHARDIRVPIYITVQWDHYTAERHPEWLVINEKGTIKGTPPYEAGFYRALCVNTPYLDFLKSHVEEVLQTLPTDGIFFDIVGPQDCSCRYCREGMLEKGLEPSDAQVRKAYGLEIINNFKHDMTRFVRKYNKDCTIFYNAGHIAPRHRSVAKAFTHFELESLPTGGWGYSHFPITMHYARNHGLDCLGMTGKFHTTWGDFHSFKNQAALEFECFRMLALNAKCSVGDQLPPSGKICQTTYELIGSVYCEVEKKEPWCVNAVPLSDIGVLTPEEFLGEVTPSLRGLSRMLHEGFHQFEIVDSESDFSQFKVLILPDEIPVYESLNAKIDDYIKAGGSVIASYQSGLNERKDEFGLDALGLSFKGDAPFSPDFIVPEGMIGDGMPETEHVMYMKGLEVEPKHGTEILADINVPYFNRTYKHFCSHRHTPSSGKVGYPGILKKGRAIYFVHPIFRQYDQNAPLWCKTLFLNALKMLLPEPLVRTDGPSTLFVTLNAQPREKRLVLHLLHYVPERRSQSIDIVEDVIPLYDVSVSLRLDDDVKGVHLAPQGDPVGYTTRETGIEFTVSQVRGHQMVEITL